MSVFSADIKAAPKNSRTTDNLLYVQQGTEHIASKCKYFLWLCHFACFIYLKKMIFLSNMCSAVRVAHLCTFQKFYPYEWINLLTGQECFADRCPWQSFRTCDWINLVGRKKSFLKFLKLEYLDSEESLQKILRKCYFGDSISYKGTEPNKKRPVKTFRKEKSYFTGP